MQCWWLIKLKWTVQSKQRIHASAMPQRSSTINNSSCTAFLLYYKAPIQIWDTAKQQPPIICNNLNWNNKNAISCSCWLATSPNTKIFTWERSYLLHLFLSGSVWVPWDAKVLSQKSCCTTVITLSSWRDCDRTKRNSKARKSKKETLDRMGKR